MGKSFFCQLIVLPLFLFPVTIAGQFVVEGRVQDDNQNAVSMARVTLFNDSLTYFAEKRTNGNGIFSFPDVPGGQYRLGVAQRGKAYEERIIAPPATDLQIMLDEESEPGLWEIIMESPEPLGGTDLGVLLHNGTIYYCHDTKDPFIFDPHVNDTVSAKGSESNQGCVGPIQTEDGKIWFLGGTLSEIYGPGTKRVKYYDPDQNTWALQPELLDYRWYPTVALMPDGKILVAGGGNLNNPQRTKTSELYDPATGESIFTGDLAIGNEISPIVVLYNGRTLMTHRPPQLFIPETREWVAAGSFVQSPRMPNGDHSDCELVLLPGGDVIAVGYKTFTPGVYGSFIERYHPDSDTWSLGSSLLPIRSRAKTCLLPDKQILVMGGFKEDTTGTPVNQYGYMKITDVYNPETDSWRRLDAMNFFREYHALGILVPDGRVIMVGGEGAPGNEPPQSMVEAFHPPYLFRGIRPEIENLHLTSLPRGGQLEFDIFKTDSLTEVILMSHAVVTHFMNSGNNRFLSLDFSQSGNHVRATLPTDSVKLIPGFYMLFAMVDDIPSVAKIIHIRDEIFSEVKKVSTEIPLLSFSPNPADDYLFIQYAADVPDCSIEIFDMRGNLVLSANNKTVIEISGLPSGVYVLTAAEGKRSYSQTLFKR